MTNQTRETIKAAIDAYLFDADLQETYRRLNLSLDYVVEARFDDCGNYTKQDVEDFIFSDNDALDSGEVDSDTALWNETRDIQKAMVNYFEQR